MSRLYITEAKDAGNLMVDLLFSDQTSRRVDIGDFIRRHPHPQYNKYLDPRKFNHFVLENGNIYCMGEELGFNVPYRTIT